jgi:hypothetical protein
MRVELVRGIHGCALRASVQLAATGMRTDVQRPPRQGKTRRRAERPRAS